MMEQPNPTYKPYRFIIAGGGTGGHIFPAVAIAHALKKMAPGSEFLFIGAKGKMEMEKVPQAGFAIRGLTISGFNRSSLIKNISLPYKLVKSFFEVASIMKGFRPDAVLGVGGYSTYPVLRYAQAKGIPTFIHEANSFAGKSNIMLGKKASKIYTGTRGMEKFFPSDRLMVTGNPVRQSISGTAGSIRQDAALDRFGLKPGMPTVLVVGGSLGAKNINEAVEKDISLFDKNGLQLIWQTGKPFLDRAKLATANRPGVFVSDFITDMENAYAAADLVISRSGAMAVAELCIVKKPVIFVPFPHAAEDHQTVNAMNLVNEQAAMIVKDSAARENLVPAAISLAADADRRRYLAGHIARLAIQDADDVVAKDMLETLSKLK